jgi:heat shock transcription factor
VLTFDSKDTIGPSMTRLADDEADLQRSYHDASDIEADVDVLQTNINELIENMGLDPAALANTSPASTHLPPPLPLSGEMPPAQTAADFDFEAFLTAFANAHDGEGGVATVDDKTSASGPAPGSGLASGTGTDTANVFSEQPVVVGRKRTSDVAELALPLPDPSGTTTLNVAAATRTNTTAGEPPRVKRNKK